VFRSLEVLDLIGRVLNFTDQQKEAVGLKVPSINLISSIFSTIVGLPKAPPPEIEVTTIILYYQLVV
jgi:hypothetical protein